MGGSAGRIVAAVVTGGQSEVYRAASNAIPGKAGQAVGTAISPAGAAGAVLENKLKPPTLPAAPPGAQPTPPTLTDAAKQAALDEQKRAGQTGPDPLTNIGGAQGILTDPSAKYQKAQLLGGA